jgi:hypothetical protein
LSGIFGLPLACQAQGCLDIPSSEFGRFAAFCDRQVFQQQTICFAGFQRISRLAVGKTATYIRDITAVMTAQFQDHPVRGCQWNA